MAKLTQVCVYCGSGDGRNPAFSAAAVALGRAMAEAGIRLVYGGGSIGLMGTLARAVLDNGGAVTGIIPQFLEEREQLFADVTDLHVTEDMHQRKMLMFEQAEAFVALPGGIGTLEEFVEQLTWVQLGRHRKPVLLANIDGFWQPLIDLFEQMRAELFLRAGMEINGLIVDRAEDIVPRLIKAVAARPQEEVDLSAEDMRIRRL